MTDFLVSILIPTFNRELYIEETLNSIINQTYNNWECIIVDDGSTDSTVNIINTYLNTDKRFDFYTRPESKPKGANACRNYGFKHSKGQYILFLDSDDILSQTCLEKRIQTFKNNAFLDFVIANTSFYSNGQFLKKPICYYDAAFTAPDYLNQFLEYKLPWTIMGVLWKRTVIENIDFDEELPRLQDIDFHIQALLQPNLQCIRLNKVDTYYRSNLNSKTTKAHQKNVINASYLFFRKYVIFTILNSKQKKHFRRFVILFLIKYIYPYNVKHISLVNKIDQVIKKSKIFSFKEIQLIYIYKTIIILNLDKTKGLGIHKLTKAIKRQLKYE